MSLPMPSGNCWTKRTTESNRTAPEILRGFFAPYPPADASCRKTVPRRPIRRPSHHAGTDPYGPAPSPLSSPLTSSPIPARLSYPSPLLRQNPAHPTLPHHAGTDPYGPAAQPAILAAHQLPHSRTALPSKPTPKAKPGTPHAFPSHRHRPTRPSHPARYPRRSPAPPFPHSSPIQAHS